MIRRGIKDTLSDSGQIIVTGEAGSQEELKNVLRSVRCEILVLDLNLPGRGGLEIIPTLKEAQPTSGH